MRARRTPTGKQSKWCWAAQYRSGPLPQKQRALELKELIEEDNLEAAERKLREISSQVRDDADHTDAESEGLGEMSVTPNPLPDIMPFSTCQLRA